MHLYSPGSQFLGNHSKELKTYVHNRIGREIDSPLQLTTILQ